MTPPITLSHPGAIPIALSLSRVSGIRELLEQSIGCDSSSNFISPGILAETLVSALLCGCRPLYKIESFWENNEFIELFYQDDGICCGQLNDDAYARMLDTLSSQDCRRLFENVCLNMLQYHGLDIVLTHSDTTSVSVEGVYSSGESKLPDQSPVEDVFCIHHGHSKDHRPDLKQFKIGLSVQENGLPISGELLSGNTSDKNWNPQMGEELSAMLFGNGYKDVLFLADSALISTKSLRNFAHRGIPFISRFPETFKLATELKTQAWEENNWKDIGTLAEQKKNASHYKTWEAQSEIEGETFGFVVVHSSNLEERKEKTLQKTVDGSRKGLQKQSEELFKKNFACETDARKDGLTLQKKIEKEGFSSEVETKKIETVKYGRRGRPKKGEEPKKEVTWRVEVKIGQMKPEVYEKKRKEEATFVLIHRINEEKTSEEIVRSYKNQDKVEQGFKFIKQPQYLGPVYTKITSRVKALGYIFLMVLLVAKYREYRVRIGMRQCQGVLKIGGQKVLNPSAKTILEILNEMMVYRVNAEWKLPDNIQTKVRDVIHGAGFDEEVYVRGYTRDRFHVGERT
jgi:transposase